MKKFLVFVMFLLISNLALAETYIVQPGDVLFVSVCKEEDLQRPLLVRPDGGISFPLVGTIVLHLLPPQSNCRKKLQEFKLFLMI